MPGNEFPGPVVANQDIGIASAGYIGFLGFRLNSVGLKVMNDGHFAVYHDG